eukprot:372575_1
MYSTYPVARRTDVRISIKECSSMKVLVHRIPYQRIATGSMIWNLDMKLTEVEGINHLFELFEMNLDLMKHPECVLWSLLQLISLGCGLGGDVLSNPDHNQIRCRVHLAFICVSVATQIRD